MRTIDNNKTQKATQNQLSHYLYKENTMLHLSEYPKQKTEKIPIKDKTNYALNVILLAGHCVRRGEEGKWSTRVAVH